MSEFKRIFSISADVDRFLLLQEADLELAIQATDAEPLVLKGEPVADRWEPIAVDWLVIPGEEDQGLKVPDIAALGATAFAVPASVADMLRPHFEGRCEFLPVRVRQEPWFLLNILSSQPALDEEKSVRKKRRDGRVTRMFEKVVFNSAAINDGRIFKIPGLGGTYCTDEVGGLFDLVKKDQLTGLRFKEASHVE